MRIYLSARQAWHDCFFVPSKDRLQLLLEACAPSKASGMTYRKVMVEDEKEVDEQGKPVKHILYVPLISARQDESYKGDFFDFWDPIWRAQVKKAIKTLNKTLQAFGMYMYAPSNEVSADEANNVQDFIKTMFYQSVEPSEIIKWKPKKPIVIHFLVFAAMKFHRDIVFGGQSKLSSVKGISDYLHHQYGERLSDSHWARDWDQIWNKLGTIINEMERNALAPVASILNQEERESA